MFQSLFRRDLVPGTHAPAEDLAEAIEKAGAAEFANEIFVDRVEFRPVTIRIDDRMLELFTNL